MNSTPASISPTGSDTVTHPTTPWPAILWGTLLCGVLDIAAAFINAGVNGVSPYRVLKGIASALLGATARDGGWAVATLGLGMHFFVAFAATVVFYALSRRFSLLTERAVVCGLLYGAVVYLTMNFAVLPLAAKFRSLYLPATRPFVPAVAPIPLAIHFVFVGLPIALAVRRFARPASEART